MDRNAAQREMGLAILTGDSAILNVARELSAIFRQLHLDAAVVGGVAVVLHGHIRTTIDVDIYTPDPSKLHEALTAAGITWDSVRREFSRQGVPIHIVTPEQIPTPPRQTEDIDDIRTISLADLISVKLRSGSRDVLRSQDLADVIALIRHHRLTGRFTPKLTSDVRSEFRELAREIANRG